MEPDDLLCSRNARPQKALVERAQWEINQAPSLKRPRASLEGAFISFDARTRGSTRLPSGRRDSWALPDEANILSQLRNTLSFLHAHGFQLAILFPFTNPIL